MFAHLGFSQNIQRTLNYNECKVKKGYAECILAENFLKDLDQLSFQDKLGRFKDLMALNERAKVNTMHLSINFHPSDKLNLDQLIEIADIFMDRIGFASQPFLVYRHHDAGHPHFHIVSTNIQPDGSRIQIYKSAMKNFQQPSREIERSYGLVSGTKQEKKLSETKPGRVQKIRYGRSQTINSIAEVLDQVLKTYQYRSLADLNLLLSLYNIKADPGKPGGWMHNHGGLLYRILGDRGQQVGLPIKASSIYFRPTLNFLEQKFKENMDLIRPNLQRLKNAIEWTLRKNPRTMEDFLNLLEKEHIAGVAFRNKDRSIEELGFVDHEHRTVTNGKDLGTGFALPAILERIGINALQDTRAESIFLQKKDPSDKPLLWIKKDPQERVFFCGEKK
jgi:Relaxase/Mobilisation nuclease domain